RRSGSPCASSQDNSPWTMGLMAGGADRAADADEQRQVHQPGAERLEIGRRVDARVAGPVAARVLRLQRIEGPARRGRRHHARAGPEVPLAVERRGALVVLAL